MVSIFDQRLHRILSFQTMMIKRLFLLLLPRKLCSSLIAIASLKHKVLEKVDQISLVWLECLLASKLVYSELLNNLQQVDFLDELTSRIPEEFVSCGCAWPAAQTILLVKAEHAPKAPISVAKGLP